MDSFQIRNGITDKPLITNDFPETARIGLIFLIKNLVELRYIKTGYGNSIYQYINTEIQRIARDLTSYPDDEITPIIKTMDWDRIFQLMERIFSNLLIEKESYGSEDDYVPIEAVKQYYTQEVNNLLSEENINFDFANGVFLRKGYIKTQQSVGNTMAVLSDPILIDSRKHYLKALRYFRNIETTDYENVIKEAVCSLESALQGLGVKGIEKKFENSIRTLIGNDKNSVPAPIIESVIKVFGYRNNGNGVAHGNCIGLKVSEKEAELLLSLCGDYITYFYSLLKKSEEDILF